MNSNLPSFFIDDSESDKIEEVIDYFLSWTLRCSIHTYKMENELLNKYCKQILSYLLYEDFEKLDLINVIELKVFKQSSNIDLWIEIRLENDPKLYVLIIENKFYSNIRNGQLEKYKNIATEYYKDQNVDIKYLFIRPDFELEAEKEFVVQNNYRYVIIEEIQYYFKGNEEKNLPAKSQTSNDIFNEFWFKW